MLYRKSSIATFIFAGLVSACAQPLEIPNVSVGDPIRVQERKVPPIKFTKLVVKPENEKLSHLATGMFCESSVRRINPGREINPKFIEIYSLAIADEFKAHGYDLRGKSENLFIKKTESQPDLQLAGVVVDIRNNVCIPGQMPGGRPLEKGTAYLKVNWKIYDTDAKKIVFEATTEGVGTIKEYETDGSLVFHRAAMTMASRNLLARKDFYDIVTSDR